jgi:hypothetical protein
MLEAFAMPCRPPYAHPSTPPTTPAGLSAHTPPDLPPCPECKTGELFRYLDRPTQTEEIVCLECGHVAPGPPPAVLSEWPRSPPSGGLASAATLPPPVEEPGGHPGDPPGTSAGVVLAARAFAVATLGDRWRRVEVVVIGHDGLPALTVTTHHRRD